jgi:hypothetical protein
MSRLTLSSIGGKSSNGNLISIVPGTTFTSPGFVVQTIYNRSDAISTYTSAVGGNGNTITDLNLTIAPKFANSLLVMTWQISGEMHWDNVFLIHRDGSLVTDSGYEGYNRVIGNVGWSGIAAGVYDNDTSSTASSWTLQYAIPAGSVATRTYAPAVRSSSTTTYTFILNRTITGPDADGLEVEVSSGVIMEVAQ